MSKNYICAGANTYITEKIFLVLYSKEDREEDELHTSVNSFKAESIEEVIDKLFNYFEEIIVLSGEYPEVPIGTRQKEIEEFKELPEENYAYLSDQLYPVLKRELVKKTKEFVMQYTEYYSENGTDEIKAFIRRQKKKL